MTPFDAAGLGGVGLILAAYAGAAFGRLDATKAPALIMNLAGASLILLSLMFAFNLSALVMEAAWAAVAVIGLVRLTLRARQAEVAPVPPPGRARNVSDRPFSSESDEI